MKGECAIAALLLGAALILGAASGGVRAQPVAGAIAPSAVDKATMDREREISRHLSAADRERARKLFEDGYTLGLQNNDDAAHARFEQGLAIDPANAPANSMFAYLLLQHDQFDTARARLTRTIYFAPKSSEAADAKVALEKLAKADATMPVKPDMSGACRPLVENFIAAAQKNDGPAAKAGYDALHAAGGCGIAKGPLLSAEDEAALSASVAAQGASGPTAAGTAASLVRYISLGLKLGQELEEVREEFAAASASGAIKNPFAGGSKNPFAPVSLPAQAKAGSPVTGKPPANGAPSAPGAGPPMSPKCQGLVQNLVSAAKANDGPGAKAGYDALQQAGGCGVVSSSPSSPVTPAPDQRFATRGDTPMIDQTFVACDQQPERCNQVVNQLREGTSPAVIAALYANAIGVGLQLGAEMAQGMAAMQPNVMRQPQINVRVPNGRQTDMRSLAGPTIRSGIGQGAPTYKPPVNTQSTITGTTN
jgi:hypothetical protein